MDSSAITANSRFCTEAGWGVSTSSDTSESCPTTALRRTPRRHRSFQCRSATVAASMRPSSASPMVPRTRPGAAGPGSSQCSSVSVSAAPIRSAPPTANASLRFIRSFSVMSTMSCAVLDADHKSPSCREDSVQETPFEYSSPESARPRVRRASEGMARPSAMRCHVLSAVTRRLPAMIALTCGWAMSTAEPIVCWLAPVCCRTSPNRAPASCSASDRRTSARAQKARDGERRGPTWDFVMHTAGVYRHGIPSSWTNGVTSSVVILTRKLPSP